MRTPRDHQDNDFYIGYHRQAPAGLSRFIGRIVLAILLVAAGLAMAVPSLFQPADPGNFEFGRQREVEGVLREAPYPSLLVAPDGAGSSYDLVSVGKWGAGELAAGLDGSRVRARGTLIERAGARMLELAPQGLARTGSSLAEPEAEELGEVTLTGEIVDSKCYLGVMKPGRGAVHRDCAVRCISGGIPPVFVARTVDGKLLQLLLVDHHGGAVNQRVLDKVAEPLSITGRLSRQGGRLLLAADPSTYRRLEER